MWSANAYMGFTGERGVVDIEDRCGLVCGSFGGCRCFHIAWGVLVVIGYIVFSYLWDTF